MAAFPLYPQESAEALAAAIQGRMNETKTLSADFIQTKRLNVMKHDLIIRGEVALDKKGRHGVACVFAGAATPAFTKETNLRNGTRTRIRS